jgi:hypothetical protein
MVRKALAGAGALLVLFHVWLFAGQILAGELADAALLGRWAVAGGLLVALEGLRRRGAPIGRSRQGVAIWLLAALLHAPAMADRLADAPAPPIAEAVSVLSAATLIATLAAGLAFLLALFGAPRRPGTPRVPTRAIVLPPGLNLSHTWLTLASRPPPVR